MSKFLRHIWKAGVCLLLVTMLIFGGVFSCGKKDSQEENPPADTSYKPTSSGNYFYSDRTVIKGKTQRKKPEMIGSLPRYPIPTKPQLNLSATEIDAIYEENQSVMDSCVADIANNQLKKHIAADGQFYGILPENVQPVIKEILVDTRRAGGRILGFAPAGEIVKITLPEGVTLDAFMGYEEPHFNIPREKFSAKSHNRMPILEKAFKLKGGDNYIGTPFGGAVSIFINSTSIAPFTIRIEGVIENPVFDYGITTNEEWDTRRMLPGLTAEIYTRYARIIVPSSKIRATTDMEAIAEYWYKSGCLSTYANNQENSRTYPVTLNFDNYVAAGLAVNVGGKFTMQPLSAADATFNVQNVRYNHTWGNMHELNHSFQNSGNVRWGIEESGEITNNVLSVLSMINYTDIALKRTESPLPFRDDTTDPYNNFSSTMKWYRNDKIADYSQYWEEDGVHYNYFIFSDIAHALGVDNAVKFIRSYGDGSCPPLTGFNSTAKNSVYPEIVKINRRDFALRTAKVLGYDMTYYLSEINKMHLSQEVIDEVKALKKPEFKPAANLYSFGRDDGTTRAQTGRPFVISYNQPYDFDFVGKTLTPYDFTISKEPKAQNGKFEKQSNGKYRYIGNGSYDNDFFSFTIKLSDNSQIEFFGEIAFSYNGTSVSAWKDIDTSDIKVTGLNKASEIADTTPPTEVSFNKSGISIPNNTGKHFHRTQGKFVVPMDGLYTFYVKADDFSNFYLSTDSSPLNLTLILSNTSYSANYSENFKSLQIALKKGQKLFFRFEVYNPSGAGQGRIGYKIDNGSIVDVPSNTIFAENISDEQIENALKGKTYMLDNQYLSPFAGKSISTELSKEGYSVLSAPKSTWDAKIENMIDGNDKNYYYSTVSGERKITLDFGKVQTFNNFSVIPNPSNANGNIEKYAIYSSEDGKTFNKIFEGAASGGRINTIFDTLSTRYFMLEVLSTKSANNLSFAELYFYQSFDSRKGAAALRNDNFTYSSRPSYEFDGLYESNHLTVLSPEMTATVKFSGQSLAVFAKKSTVGGKMEVIVDGVSLGVLDLYSPGILYGQRVFFTGSLVGGEHTLILKCIEGAANLDFIQVNKS